MNDDRTPNNASAVLVSGGMDSAILLAETLRDGRQTHPLYVRSGLYWESSELNHLRRFLQALARPALRPLQVLDVPVADLYADHWSITGRSVPDAESPDAAVYLPGRNVLLLAKGMLWCHLHQVPELALGLLESNPFPDATPEFFTGFQDAVNRSVTGWVVIRRPFAGLAKTEILRRAGGLPLELTFSCLYPIAGRHCGRCNKCAERRRAFAEAGVLDPTPYQADNVCTA
jgi:7-cyano-7-deazaguanine synthase